MDKKLREETLNLLDEIIEIHSEYEGNMIDVCTDKEQTVLDNLKILIEEYGHKDLFLTRAVLMACNNWYTMHLVRESSFNLDLADGVHNYGSLAPDRYMDWESLQFLAEANPDMYYMEDMEYFYDIVCTAIEQGDDDIACMATTVSDIIWEPEKIIEED